MSNPSFNPLRYELGIEQTASDEGQTTAALIEQFLKISGITYRDGGHGLRAAHAKSHGLLEAELTVLEGLSSDYAQGLFAKPGTYPAYLRLSTSPGDMLPDDVSTPRGLAIKIVGVEGERLPGSQGEKTQDLVLVTGKAFIAPTPKAFLGSVKLLAATTDKAGGAKEVLSAFLRSAERVVEAVGGESATLKGLGGYPETHILGESFFSQVPIRYGDYIAKIGVYPVSPELMRLTNSPLNVHGKPDGLREAVRDFFGSNDAVWEVRAQLCTDLENMPIEDASKQWDEKSSPYVTVARLVAKAQDTWSDKNYKAIDTAMSFSPWHGLAAHRPLGGIMRVRKAVYEKSAQFRGSRNGCPMSEPSLTVAPQ